MWRFLLNVLYPKKCVHCGLPGLYLCKQCHALIVAAKPPIHIGVGSLEAICSFYRYGEVVQSLIRVYKYDLVFSVKSEIFDLIDSSSTTVPTDWLTKACFMPIPLHKKRMHKRGFNQASDIANHFSHLLHVPVLEDVLIKTKHVEPQAHLKSRERHQSVKDSFGLCNDLPRTVQRVLLIDDVYTTGATMQEAANVLRSAFPHVLVYGITFARG